MFLVTHARKACCSYLIQNYGKYVCKFNMCNNTPRLLQDE